MHREEKEIKLPFCFVCILFMSVTYYYKAIDIKTAVVKKGETPKSLDGDVSICYHIFPLYSNSDTWVWAPADTKYQSDTSVCLEKKKSCIDY